MNDEATTTDAATTDGAANTGTSQEQTIEDIAREEVFKRDYAAEKLAITPYDQVRLRHEPQSATEMWARRAVDAGEAFAGLYGDGKTDLTDLVNLVSPSEYRAIRQAAYRAAEESRTSGGKK